MKRAFDVLIAAIGLVLFGPLMLVIASVVAIKMGRPVLLRQKRPGLHGKPFYLCKFRTMTNAVDAQGQVLPDEDRLTRIGAWLRSASLDELPELWNVVRGDMSLVGPRPLLVEYLELYTPEQARRHSVRPGITGWAQINGRNASSWSDRLAQDIWYVDNQSFWLDIKILCMTAWKVVARADVSHEGHATMPRFTGTHKD